MTREVRVHLLPSLFEPEDLRGGIAVVIDVLRASTTIIHALAHGAKCVVPCFTVDEARKAASVLARGAERSPTVADTACGVASCDEVLLGGERDGVLIPGFDLDNNPFAYTEEVVKDKTIVFTTTNGTAALHRAAMADRVLIGAFINLRAVANVLSTDDHRVHLVCAGTRGKITAEDVLCAGAMVDRLQAADQDTSSWRYNDELLIATRLYAADRRDPKALRELVRLSDGGRNCIRLGFDNQVDRAATFDLFDIVPEYEHATGRIVRAP